MKLIYFLLIIARANFVNTRSCQNILWTVSGQGIEQQRAERNKIEKGDGVGRQGAEQRESCSSKKKMYTTPADGSFQMEILFFEREETETGTGSDAQHRSEHFQANKSR